MHGVIGKALNVINERSKLVWFFAVYLHYLEAQKVRPL